VKDACKLSLCPNGVHSDRFSRAELSNADHGKRSSNENEQGSVAMVITHVSMDVIYILCYSGTRSVKLICRNVTFTRKPISLMGIRDARNSSS
jgi:hypothetical protein